MIKSIGSVIAVMMLLCACNSTSSRGDSTPSTDTNTDTEVDLSTNGPVNDTSDYETRANYGVPLESENRIWHCSGQAEFDEGFGTYNDTMFRNQRAGVYSHYLQLATLTSNSFEGLKQYLAEQRAEDGIFVIPHLAIVMTYDPNPSTHYEQDVAIGRYDYQIDVLVESLKELGMPVFLRIGYEANGWEWNGYEPESFVAAYQRIVDAVREAEVPDVALVWHPVPEENTNNPNDLMDYYPGDDYVDWIGTSYFNVSDFTTAQSYIDLLEEADQRSKPVMIAESTPKGVGVEDGQADWDEWFKVYFDTVKANPGIKAFCYINWNWAQKRSDWHDWGNGVLGDNDLVAANYRAEMADPIIQHGVTETGFWSEAMGETGVAVPQAVTDLALELTEDNEFNLTWNNSDDSIKRFEIELNGEVVETTYHTQYTGNLAQFEALSTVELDVAAVNAGGRTLTSQVQTLTVPNNLNKIIAGDFEELNVNWEASMFVSGLFTYGLDETNKLSSHNSVRLMVMQPTDTFWHLQYRHKVNTTAAHSYSISYQLTADAEASVTVMLQQGHDPFGSIYEVTHELSAGQVLEVSNEVALESADDIRYLTFMIGDVPENASVWLDNVSVIETK